jgi:hypothetical protein
MVLRDYKSLRASGNKALVITVRRFDRAAVPDLQSGTDIIGFEIRFKDAGLQDW